MNNTLNNHNVRLMWLRHIGGRGRVRFSTDLLPLQGKENYNSD
jgi:hypothetical protein